MKRVNMIATACVTAMLAVLTLNVAAQDFNANENTYMTFSGAVELPGTTLQAGTYLFRLAESQSNRHIVQVFTQDRQQILATILAVPAERMEVTGETVVTFRETAEGATPAVQYWYYPGDKIGHEFVYPKDQAERIAKRTGQTVLSTEGDVASAGSTVSSIGPDGEVTEWKREDASAQTARNEPGQVSGAGATATTEQPEPETVAPTAESTTARSAHTDSRGHSSVMDSQGQTVGTAGDPSELPRTASALPLSGLIGLLSVGGALAIRRYRRS